MACLGQVGVIESLFEHPEEIDAALRSPEP
jgi:hypothetical protein